MVLPSIKPGNLCHQRTICRNLVGPQEFPDLLVGHITIFRRKGIDRRRDEMLIQVEVLGIFGQRKDSPVILFDEPTQIIPYRGIWRRKIDMALPQPRHFPVREMLDQRQRLRVVHDDCVAVVKVKSRGIFEHDLFVYRSFSVRKFHALALQRVVKHLGATKEAWGALDQMPVSFDAYRVHHQR